MYMPKFFNLRPATLLLALPAALLISGCSEQETANAAAGMTAQIERFNEGRNFYGVISIPPGAETLYLSGAGADPRADGSWGSMEEQAVDIFTTFRKTLEDMGWSLADIVQVRVFATAGEDGMLDFAGFNSGYQQFFGSEINPMKPVRSFVQVADLVRDGWLVEVEIRAARMPK